MGVESQFIPQKDGSSPRVLVNQILWLWWLLPPPSPPLTSQEGKQSPCPPCLAHLRDLILSYPLTQQLVPSPAAGRMWPQNRCLQQRRSLQTEMWADGPAGRESQRNKAGLWHSREAVKDKGARHLLGISVLTARGVMQ